MQPDESLTANLFELRKKVEPEAAALATLWRTDLHMEALEYALAVMKQATLATEAGRRADQAFHSTLLDAPANAFIVSLSTSVSAAVAWTTIFKQQVKKPARDPIPDHEAVYRAVERQDHAAAREAMVALIDLALKDTLAARRELCTEPRRR